MTDKNNPLPATADASAAKPIVAIDQELFRDVRVDIEARLGRAELSVDALMALKSGSVVTLSTGLADHVDLYVNDACVARGEIVAVGDKFGVRIVEVAAKQ
ncbi:MAG TPA: FliM/FliN family flagellar motor switch protein [Acetobacteraceae bacterium]|nr:FliM/FliN family flagellar motor switch protein [Acetobacteraceae bacterium]